MCISPNTLANGLSTSCHECWQCRERAINDWVGRNIAESKTAVASHAVTLTYGRNKANEIDHEHAALLTYSDVQKYFKLLRFHGYPVRYFATGEYGSLKGRAHWHIMLYWQDKVPPHILDENFMQSFPDKDGNDVHPWPHGWSFWTKPTPKAVRYNCKYIQKDMGDDARQGHMAMSRKPPLGAVYFQQMAERYVDQQLAPQTLEYRFPEVRRRKPDGSEEVLPFVLKDRPAELFLDHYIAAWRKRYGDKPYPLSDLVDGWERYGVLTEPARDAAQEEADAVYRRDIEKREKEIADALRELAKVDAEFEFRKVIENGKWVDRWVPKRLDLAREFMSRFQWEAGDEEGNDDGKE